MEVDNLREVPQTPPCNTLSDNARPFSEPSGQPQPGGSHLRSKGVMTVSFFEMANHERMYSFVGDDGENIHVAIERLFKWVQEHKFQLRVYSTPVHPYLAKKFILAGLVNQKRALELLQSPPKDPIIYGKEKPGAVSKIDMYLLDGRHRYVIAAGKNQPVIDAYILEPKQWLKFQVTDIPTMSQADLHRIPVRSGPR